MVVIDLNVHLDIVFRFEYVLGDSAQSLPGVIEMNPDFKCDVISVDGSHSFEGAYAVNV